MGLKRYYKKRDFKKTPEPKGAVVKTKNKPLSFTVQKHAARRLHYDFRLEMDGVLKSWAVPKGPSSNPEDRRLAVHVEDHPLSYGSFEGVIPKGEYGAGTVEVWDRGIWIPKSDPREGYEKGALKFDLQGEKLKGSWALVKMKGRAAGDGKDNWLLIKEKSDGLARIAKKETVRPPLSELPKEKMPDGLRPQLATLAKDCPAGSEWIHEVKFDGYRVLALIQRGKVKFITRNGNDWTEKFSALAAPLLKLPAGQAVLDGEIVVLADSGLSSFQDLQNALDKNSTDELIYFVFDLLHLDGANLRGLPLLQRKKFLADLFKAQNENGAARYVDHIEGRGKQFYEQSCKFGLEGIVSKRKERPYIQDRTRDWVKVKCILYQEFVIAGFTDAGGSRSGFGALLLGVYQDGKLTYSGRVGTGFTQESLRKIYPLLRKLESAKNPFETFPESARGVHWIKPVLVAHVQFSNWTDDGLLRHPSFQGLRQDKRPEEVVGEKPQAPLPDESASGNAKANAVAGVRLSNPGRMLYPEQGLTKLDLALFYKKISAWIIPYIIDRPLSLVRCPSGRDRECFYQKHLDETAPPDIQSVQIIEGGAPHPYPVVRDLKGIVSLVQLGALELHIWGSPASDVENPDRIVFDLDPSPEAAWSAMIQAALETRDRLRKMHLESFLKTTGGKGLHVVVPLAGRHDWAGVKRFAKNFALQMAADHPRAYTAELSKQKRGGKIFIDYLRNGRGATSIAPYSTRARPGAPLSVPISWKLLTKDLRSDAFTVKNLPLWMDGQKKDPWRGFFNVRQSLQGALAAARP